MRFAVHCTLSTLACSPRCRAYDPSIGEMRQRIPPVVVLSSRPSVVARGPATSARALLAGRERRNASRHARGSGHKGVTFVVDSGCTWHIHLQACDLVNTRSTDEVIAGVDGKPQPMSLIGDMPIDAVDSRLTLRNVRCVPSFRDSLLSVNKLWESTSTGCRFGSTLAMLSPPCASGGRLSLPFNRSSGL
eukprot:3712333-Pleurochrysis_carterae.AAC.1